MSNLKPLTSKKINTPVGLFSQVFLTTCVEDQFGNEKTSYNGVKQNTYQIEMQFDKDNSAHQSFYKHLMKIEKELLAKKFGPRFKPTHSVIKDSDNMSGNNVPEDSYVLRAKRKAAEGKTPLITLCDKQGKRCEPETFYAGCFGRLQVVLKTYEFGGMKGVNAQLLTAQFAKDGDPIVYGGMQGDTLDAVEEYDALSDDGLHDDMLAA